MRPAVPDGCRIGPILRSSSTALQSSPRPCPRGARRVALTKAHTKTQSAPFVVGIETFSPKFLHATLDRVNLDKLWSGHVGYLAQCTGCVQPPLGVRWARAGCRAEYLKARRVLI